MIDTNKLKASLAGGTYDELREFLSSRLDELRDIANVKEYSTAQDQAVELKAQLKAYKKLSIILSEIITLHDLPEIPKADENDYGVDGQ